MQSRKNRWLLAAGAAVACAGVLVAANVAFAGDRGSGAPSVLRGLLSASMAWVRWRRWAIPIGLGCAAIARPRGLR